MGQILPQSASIMTIGKLKNWITRKIPEGMWWWNTCPDLCNVWPVQQCHLLAIWENCGLQRIWLLANCSVESLRNSRPSTGGPVRSFNAIWSCLWRLAMWYWPKIPSMQPTLKFVGWSIGNQCGSGQHASLLIQKACTPVCNGIVPQSLSKQCHTVLSGTRCFVLVNTGQKQLARYGASFEKNGTRQWWSQTAQQMIAALHLMFWKTCNSHVDAHWCMGTLPSHRTHSKCYRKIYVCSSKRALHLLNRWVTKC